MRALLRKIRDFLQQTWDFLRLPFLARIDARGMALTLDEAGFLKDHYRKAYPEIKAAFERVSDAAVGAQRRIEESTVSAFALPPAPLTSTREADPDSEVTSNEVQMLSVASRIENVWSTLEKSGTAEAHAISTTIEHAVDYTMTGALDSLETAYAWLGKLVTSERAKLTQKQSTDALGLLPQHAPLPGTIKAGPTLPEYSSRDAGAA